MNPKRNSDVEANTEDTEKEPASRGWDDEVDFRKAVSVVAAWWREIVLGGVLAAIMGGAVTAALEAASPRYEASADVAIASYLGKAASDAHGATQMDRNPEDRHRAMLVGLIHHGSVGKKVSERLRSDWPPEDGRYIADELYGAISAELVTVGSLSKQTESNLLRISARADSPEKAVVLANIWAEEYIVEMNRKNKELQAITMEEIKTRIDERYEIYKDAQHELEEFIGDNRIVQMEHQLDVYGKIKEQVHDLRASILDEHISHQIDLLGQYYDTRLRLTELLRTAESLHAQIASGGDAGAASNELAIMLFKARVYAATDDLPNQLEIDFDNTHTAHADAAGQNDDMEAVIAALKIRLDRLNRDIAHQGNSLPSRLLNIGVADEEGLPATSHAGEKTQDAPDNYMHVFGMGDGRLIRYMELIDEKIQLIETKLETEKFKEDDLKQIRDQALSSWTEVMREIENMLLEDTASRPILHLVSPATGNMQSLWPSSLSVAMVSGTTGLLVMVLLVFLMNLLDVRPFLERRGTEHAAPRPGRNP